MAHDVQNRSIRGPFSNHDSGATDARAARYCSLRSSYVTVHVGGDIPEFLVEAGAFEASLKKFQIGSRVKMWFANEEGGGSYYTGEATRVDLGKNESDPWNSVTVRWEDGQEMQVCPWELLLESEDGEDAAAKAAEAMKRGPGRPRKGSKPNGKAENQCGNEAGEGGGGGTKIKLVVKAGGGQRGTAEEEGKEEEEEEEGAEEEVEEEEEEEGEEEGGGAEASPIKIKISLGGAKS